MKIKLLWTSLIWDLALLSVVTYLIINNFSAWYVLLFLLADTDLYKEMK